jgi:Amt family ammonium transporter
LAVLVASFVVSYLIALLLEKTIGFRVSQEDEQTGVDETEHAESGYDIGTLGASLRGIGVGATAPRRSQPAEPPAPEQDPASRHDDKEVKA